MALVLNETDWNLVDAIIFDLDGVLTDTADPELEPSEAERVVS